MEGNFSSFLLFDFFYSLLACLLSWSVSDGGVRIVTEFGEEEEEEEEQEEVEASQETCF